MGFFSKLFNRNKEITVEQENIEEVKEEYTDSLSYYKEFARLIIDNDSEVVSELENLLLDIDTFIENNRDFIDDRGLEDFDLSQEDLTWILFADILISKGYAEEFDWKCELEDFEYGLMKLNQFKTKFKTLTLPKLNSEDDVTIYAEQIGNYWKENNVCLAYIDIDSDSYVIFPIEKDRLEKLEKLGQEINKSFVSL